MIEQFFIIPYLTSRAMKSQQERQQREVALEKYQEQYRQQEESEEQQHETQKNQSYPEDVGDKDNFKARQDEISPSEDLTELYKIMVGKKINEKGKVIHKRSGLLLGKVIEGNISKLVGRKVREDGQIINSKGICIGRVEPALYGDKSHEESQPESSDEFCNPNLDENSNDHSSPRNRLTKSSLEGHKSFGHSCYMTQNFLKFTIINTSNEVIDSHGRVIGVLREEEIDLSGFKVNCSGEVFDPQDQKINKKVDIVFNVDTSYPRIGKSGEIIDASNHVIGHLDDKLVAQWEGNYIDPYGHVINETGRAIAHAKMEKVTQSNHLPMSDTMYGIINYKEDNGESEIFEDSSVSDSNHVVTRKAETSERVCSHPKNKNRTKKKKSNKQSDYVKHKSHYRDNQKPKKNQSKTSSEIADQAATCIQELLNNFRPLIGRISKLIESEEKKSQQDRNEEYLVTEVKAYIEQVISLLEGANQSLQYIVRTHLTSYTKGNKSATSQSLSSKEYHLANILAQLSADISTTVLIAFKKLKKMPLAKKELRSIWSSLPGPLIQILAVTNEFFPTLLEEVGKKINDYGIGSVANNLLSAISIYTDIDDFGVADALKLNA